MRIGRDAREFAETRSGNKQLQEIAATAFQAGVEHERARVASLQRFRPEYAVEQAPTLALTGDE